MAVTSSSQLPHSCSSAFQPRQSVHFFPLKTNFFVFLPSSGVAEHETPFSHSPFPPAYSLLPSSVRSLQCHPFPILLPVRSPPLPATTENTNFSNPFSVQKLDPPFQPLFPKFRRQTKAPTFPFRPIPNFGPMRAHG